MSDLISRSAVIEIIEREIQNLQHDTQINIKTAIEELPTAYNMERVEEEIRKYDHTCKKCETFNCSECDFVKRIDAIRKGGINE